MAVNQRVQVTRAFRVRGEDVGEGSIIDLDLPTAQEARNAKKAEFVPSDTKLVTKPLAARESRSAQGSHQVAELQSQVATLTALVEKLVPAKGAASKEKANA